MDKQSGQLEDAWRILEHHWKIQPRRGGISYTPGYSILRFIFSPIIRGIARIKATGSEHIPGRGATILAANHLSHVDPILVIASSRRKVHYLAKDAHFKNFFLRLFMNSTGQIETHREEGGDDALASAADVLAANSALGIFPEGTRSRSKHPPHLSKGKTGVARLAARFPEVPVVPMAILGARKFMAPGSAIVNPLAKVQVNIDNPITFGDWLGEEKGGDMSDEDISNLSQLDDDEQRSLMKLQYRKFTDQLIENLRILGAP